MSIATLRKPSVGRHIVPCWFKDILHSIIYSDCIQAYLAIHAIDLFLGAETPNRRILVLHAHGQNHTQIADRLTVSRFSVIRAMNRFVRQVGNDTLAQMQASPLTAEMLDIFLERGYTENENIRTVIAFLRGFTCTELGVLSALLRGLTECEAVKHACISKSRYHIVKRNLCEKIHLGEKCMGKKAPKKSAWSFRETDCFSNVLNEGDV